VLRDLFELKVGEELPVVNFELSQSLEAKYEEVVGFKSPDSNLALPPAVAAFVLKELFELFSVPPGSIHASQELNFFQEVKVGSSLSCRSKILKKIERGGLRVSVVGFEVTQSGQLTLEGQATIILGKK